MTEKHLPTIKSILLLAGSFIFAFLFGEMVHEFGHYLAHLAYGNTEVGVVLDPFGGSHITGAVVQSKIVMGITSAAGPITNLVGGLACLLILGKQSSHHLFPLKLWGPISMVQESVTLTLGLLTPGGDAQWIAAMGIPEWLLVISGLLMLCAGLFMVAGMLPGAGIHSDYSFTQALGIVLSGMCSLMVIRAVYSYIPAPTLLIENLVPLIFSLLLAVIVVLLYKYLTKLEKRKHRKIGVLSWFEVIVTVIFGGAMFVSQIFFFN